MSTSALRAQAYMYAYPGSTEVALGPVDFEIAEGSFTLLCGATGSGKTTLLRSAKSGLLPAGTRNGLLEVFGQDPLEHKPEESAQLVGYVAQNPSSQLVCDTVWHQMAFGLENLGYAPDTMRLRVADVAHYLGMQPWFGSEVSELSGGQQQLLNLASVLVMRPRLLLLDEPTAQLDPVAEKDFCHVLFRLNRELGLTVVVATHRPEVFSSYATGRIDLDQNPETPRPMPHIGPPSARDAGIAIAARDCWFAYARDSEPVLRGLDLAVRAGSMHALAGGNGCGKSTLLRLLACVHKPRRGKVANALRSRQALLPQDPQALFVCDTVREELEEFQGACAYTTAQIEAMLDCFCLHDVACQHPFDLSGGQQQLLALAKLLLTEPDLLLLDEPTKGLDAASRALVIDELDRRRLHGMTIVLATHDLAFVRAAADEVTLLFDGQSACTLPPKEFFAETMFFTHGEGHGL